MKKSVDNEARKYMKCPECGHELNGKNMCEHCGKAEPPPEADIQVEYKEFPVSEYLEIRKKFKQASEDENESDSPLSGKGKSASGKHSGGRKRPGIQNTKKKIAINFSPAWRYNCKLTSYSDNKNYNSD